MEKDFSVRPYQPGDEEGIVGLLELVFGGWPNFDLRCSPLDHWRWKYRGGPYKAEDIIVCLREGQIIGCKHSVPLNIKVGGEVLFGNIGSDLTVHPSFRNLGLSNEIRNLNRVMKKRSGYEFSYFVTSNPILVKSYSETRPPFPHTVKNFSRIRDIDLQLRMMPVENPSLKKLGYRVLKKMNDLRQVTGGRGRGVRRANISEITSFDRRIDEFWEEIAHHYNFIVERRGVYLNWRYCHPHAGSFTVKQAEDQGRVLGYSVLFVNRYRKDYPVGYIVDLLARPDRPDVAEGLVADAVDYFDNEGINIVNTLVVKDNPYEKILERHGFLDSRIQPEIFVGSGTPKEKLVILRKSPAHTIHFSYGDIDSLPSSTPRYS